MTVSAPTAADLAQFESSATTSGAEPDVASKITVRRPEFELADLPRVWVGNSRLATWFGNAGHVFIPLGEDFFIDSVKRFRDQVDAQQRQDVNAFIGQEAVHRRAHEQLWEVLEAQGVPVRAYADLVGRVRAVERVVPPTVALAVTAALEHYTAAFAHSFLTEDLHAAIPAEMARLLAWHGLEELEHRAVAFDVLQAVDDRYFVRLAGFAIATALLTAVPAAGVVLFAAADPRRARRLLPRRALCGMSLRFLGRAAAHTVDYLRPGFHPENVSVPTRAERWAEELTAAP